MLRRWRFFFRRIRLECLFFIGLGVYIVAALLIKGCQTAQEQPPAPFFITPQAVRQTPPVRQQTIRVYLHKQKRVETMDLEEYILGVLSAEMPVSFHLEALKAQAVAARTFALGKIKRHGEGSNADICTDSSHCQAWDDESSRRKKWGKNYEANLDKLTSAVYATAGEIVTYRGEAIQALFHSTSGGMTENSENAFSASLPYLRSVVSEGEEDAPRYRGEVRVKRSEFARRVNAKFPKAKLDAAKLESQVETVSTFDSGRVESIRLGKALARGRDMRALFDLNSTNFTLTFTAREAVFQTIGYGHGVGMSQTGANAMANRGADYVEILTHYYTGTEVEAISSVIEKN